VITKHALKVGHPVLTKPAIEVRKQDGPAVSSLLKNHSACLPATDFQICEKLV
jgi:hypothetical protein